MNGFRGYPDLLQSLEAVAKAKEDQFQILCEAVSSTEGYRHSLSRCNELAKKLNGEFDASKVLRLLASLRFLYDRCREWEKEGTDVASALREFLEVIGVLDKLGREPEAGFRRVVRLVDKNPAVERRRKLRWLRTGVLNTATDFASFVDIRPRFAEDRTTVEEFVPITILRVLTESETDETAVAFQFDQEGFAKLRAVVEDIAKKIDAVRNDKTIAGRIYVPVPGEDSDE